MNSQITFGKGAKEISGEMIPFSTNGTRINKCPYAKKKKTIYMYHVSLYTKINSKQIVGLNVKHEIYNS